MKHKDSLGVEIGNSRIKLVALTSEGVRARSYQVRLRGHVPRGADIADGFVTAIQGFASETGIDLACVPAAVAFSSQFAYPTFREALHDTVRLLQHYLPQARLAAADALVTLDEAGAEVGAPGGPLRFAAARPLAIAALAARFGPVDLAVDAGTTSTEIVPLSLRGALQPTNEARLTDGRLVWLGLVETPLDFVARTAAGYTVLPRVGRMAAVSGLLGLAGPFGMPFVADREALEAEIAQSVGLDAEILDADEIARIAYAFYAAAIIRIASSIARVISREIGGQGARFVAGVTAPSELGIHTGHDPGCGDVPLRAGVLGLGKNALAVPALRACSIEDFVDLEGEAGVPPNFGAAAGLAFLATDPGVDLAYAADAGSPSRHSRRRDRPGRGARV